jgi:hypothetical protein
MREGGRDREREREERIHVMLASQETQRVRMRL